MTTAATVVGHFPLVLATGPGAGARNSIGIMLVSGMIIGTVFTLFVVPSIYMLVARTRVAVRRAPARRARRRAVLNWRRLYEIASDRRAALSSIGALIASHDAQPRQAERPR